MISYWDFFVLFLQKLGGEAGSLDGVVDQGPQVPLRDVVLLQLAPYLSFRYLFSLFQVCNGPPSRVPGGLSRVQAAGHRGVPARVLQGA